jgi:hypothetical protein
MSKKERAGRRPTIRPAWVRERGLDAELVCILAGEIHSEIYKVVNVTDSRAVDAAILELAAVFQASHQESTPDGKYCDYKESDFNCEVLDYAHRFLDALKQEPDWINTKHQSMYGDETVADLLARHPVSTS